MKTHFSLFFFLFFLLALPLITQGQIAFFIEGKLKTESGKLDGAKMIIEKDGNEIRRMPLSNSGKFEYEMDFNHTYLLSFVQEGYVTKKMSFDTRVPTERMKDGFYPFEFHVTIFQQFDDINTVIFNQPVGQIMYNPEIEDFDYDKDYTQSILSQMQEVEEEITQRVKEEEKAGRSVSKKQDEVKEMAELEEESPITIKKEDKEVVTEKPRAAKPVVKRQLEGNMVVLQAYTVGEFNYPNLPAYGYINFGDGGGNREISKDEFVKYARIYR